MLTGRKRCGLLPNIEFGIIDQHQVARAAVVGLTPDDVDTSAEFKRRVADVTQALRQWRDLVPAVELGVVRQDAAPRLERFVVTGLAPDGVDNATYSETRQMVGWKRQRGQLVPRVRTI